MNHADQPTLFEPPTPTNPPDPDEATQRARLADHAAGRHCPACGTNQYPHTNYGTRTQC